MLVGLHSRALSYYCNCYVDYSHLESMDIDVFDLESFPDFSGSKIFNTFKYHVSAPMGRFQLELIYLYFPPSFHLTVVSDLYALRC